MIISDHTHVAMTKTCGSVATLICQSNTFKQLWMLEVIGALFCFESGGLRRRHVYSDRTRRSCALRTSVMQCSVGRWIVRVGVKKGVVQFGIRTWFHQWLITVFVVVSRSNAQHQTRTDDLSVVQSEQYQRMRPNPNMRVDTEWIVATVSCNVDGHDEDIDYRANDE